MNGLEEYARWKPVDTSLHLVQRTWFWMDKAHVVYWDALIVAAAERTGCRYLLSEDFQEGRRFADIVVVSPLLKIVTKLFCKLNRPVSDVPLPAR